jgi:hypothetical protein
MTTWFDIFTTVRETTLRRVAICNICASCTHRGNDTHSNLDEVALPPHPLHRTVLPMRRLVPTPISTSTLFPPGISLAQPNETTNRQKVPSERTNLTSTPSKPTRRDGEDGHGRSKGHDICGTRVDEDTALPPPTHALPPHYAWKM